MDEPARDCDQSPGRTRRERRSEVFDPPALGAHPWKQEDRSGHELAERSEAPGRGRTDDRPDIRETRAAGSQARDQSREEIAHRSTLAQRQLLYVARAPVRGPDEHKQSATG